MRAVVYTRLSKDRTGESENVAIQEAECREYADAQGWKVAGVFTDNDISASRYSRKPRPGYADMLDAIRDGQADAVLVTEIPRLYRRMDELLELIDLAERTPLRRIVTTDDTGYDLSTGQGVHAAHTAVSTAWLESRRLSDRAKRKKLAQAREGHYGGGPACYGYRAVAPGKLEIQPHEAEIIRDVAGRVLAGHALRAIARDLNDAGERTATGAMWRPTNLKRILVGHRIAGVRVHNGVEYAGTWQPILDRDTWEQVGMVLKASSRYVGAARKAGRSYLLTGLAFCGVCGGPLIGYGKRDHGDVVKRRYYCRKVGDTGTRSGCGKVSRLADPVELLVSEAVLEALDSDRMAEVLGAATDDHEIHALLGQHQAHKGRLEQARAAYADGTIGLDDFVVIKGRIEDAMAGVQHQMARIADTRTIGTVPVGESFAEAWTQAGLEWRRSLIGLVVSKVILHPFKGGARRWPPDGTRQWIFNPDTVEIRWKV